MPECILAPIPEELKKSIKSKGTASRRRLWEIVVWLSGGERQ
jgi:hypothetical protein